MWTSTTLAVKIYSTKIFQTCGIQPVICNTNVLIREIGIAFWGEQKHKHVQ